MLIFRLQTKCLILTEESRKFAPEKANGSEFTYTNYIWKIYLTFNLLLYFKVNQLQRITFFSNTITGKKNWS